MEAKLAVLEEKIATLDLAYQELTKKLSGGDKTSEKNGEEMTTVNKGSQSIEDPIAATPESRARIVHNAKSEKTDVRKDKLPDGRVLEAKEWENTKHLAFTFRKVFGETIQDEDQIYIHDTKLINLLQTHVGHYPAHALLGKDLRYFSPFESIVFEWDKLEEIASATNPDSADHQAESDLALLLKTISENCTDPKLDQLLKNRSVNKEQKRITFETLWTLFPPGEIIFGTPFQEQPQLFIVVDNLFPWPEPESRRGRPAPWLLKCWMYEWTGKKFLRKALKLKMDRFDGSKPINSLPYYPLRYHETRTDIEDELLKRGVEYRKLCIAKQGEQMFHYKGQVTFSRKWTVDPPPAESHDEEDIFLRLFSTQRDRVTTIPKTTQVEGTVIVDFISYNRYGPGVQMVGPLEPLGEDPDCNCSECRNNVLLANNARKKYDDFTADKPESEWAREQFMLCPPRVLGFVLREKQWAQLQITLVKKDSDDDKPPAFYLDKLKLAGEDSGSEWKQLLMSLVNNHGGRRTSEGKDDQVDDIVPDKGKGLVILLYGPPGVGKTSTAETIAKAAKKPLFPVNVADVGTQATYVEKNLEELFDLATAWEAILLIDESDVFLESRSRGAATTERNALVSVFLRVLEYYQGILFLTTNQIAQFDVAVQSRIHIALKYEPLNDVQTKEIFLHFLNQLNNKKQVKDLKSIQSWVMSDIVKRKAGFDGRQIRNIVSCAMNLARADRRKLEKDDLIWVVDIVRDFKDESKRQYDRYMRSQEMRHLD